MEEDDETNMPGGGFIYLFFFYRNATKPKVRWGMERDRSSSRYILFRMQCVTPLAIASVHVAVFQLPLLSRRPLKHKGEDEEVEAQIPRS